MNTGLARQLAEAALVNTLNVLESRPEGMTVRVSGEIPPARGLGSSAAVAASIASAVASAHEVTLTSDEHFDIVQSVERIAHGTPSGLDARATVASGPIWFEAGQAKPLRSQRTPRMLVADTGVKGHTSEAVAHVRNLRQADEGRIDLLLNDIAVLTERAGTALERGQMSELGDLLTSNHRLLAELGVSHPKLDRLVAVALAAGALGAKMTGGGRGGCMIALAGDEDSERHIEAALREAGATSVWNVSKRDEQ